MALASGILLLLLAVAAPAVLGVDHTVGGTDGWSQSTNFDTWAAGETFTVGDNLLFSYSSMHGVDIVSKDAYDKCSGKALKTFTGGQTTVSLLNAGPMYFICPTSGHCASGMKLAINVVSTTTTPSGNTSPSIVPPSSGSSSPNGSSNTTPSSTSSPKSNDSEGHFSNFNRTMVGFTLVVAGLVSFMG